jgi:hypothetical protein
MKAVLLIMTAMVLTACGPRPQTERPAPPDLAARPASPLPTGPVLSSVGVVAAVEGVKVTLDHEAVPGGPAAGRDVFQGHADVLAEPPIQPGSRVAFSYQNAKPLPVLTQMTAR